MPFVLKSTWMSYNNILQTSSGTHGYQTLKKAKEARLSYLNENNKKTEPIKNYNIQIIEMDVPILDVK